MPPISLLLIHLLPCSAAAQQPDVFWQYASMGSGIGWSEFAVAEVNGQPELFCGASTVSAPANTYWYALRRDAGTGEWEHSYVAPEGTAEIVRLRVGALLAGAGDSLALLRGDGVVEIRDPASKALLGSFPTAASGPNSMDLADYDGDGLEEFFIVDDARLWLYDSGGALRRTVLRGGADVLVAQMDADPALEIALASGAVLDGSSFAVQWTWNAAYVTELESGDVDGDGMDELIAMPSQGLIHAYDVDTGATIWALQRNSSEAIRLTDLEGDGTWELLVGAGQDYGLKCYDARTAGFLWSLGGGESEIADVVAFDADGNGDLELAWSSGALSTSADDLWISDWQSGATQWKSDALDGPFLGPAIGDLDGDQIPELVVASFESESHYGDGRILVFDSRTLERIGLSPPVADDHSALGINDLQLADLDGDGRKEILVATDEYYDGRIVAYSFAGGVFTQAWTNPQPAPQSASFLSLAVADVDRDGDLEIVGGTGRQSSGPSVDEELFYVFDVNSRTEEWRSAEIGLMGDLVTEIEVADFDRDGIPEIYGMVRGGSVYVYDGLSKALQRTIGGVFTSLRAVESGPDTFLVTGDSGGWVRAYASVGGAGLLLYARQLASSEITGIHPGPAGGAWIAAAGRLSLVDLASGTPSWQSEDYGPTFGRSVAHPDAAFLPFFSAGRYALLGFR